MRLQIGPTLANHDATRNLPSRRRNTRLTDLPTWPPPRSCRSSAVDRRACPARSGSPITGCARSSSSGRRRSAAWRGATRFPIRGCSAGRAHWRASTPRRSRGTLRRPAWRHGSMRRRNGWRAEPTEASRWRSQPAARRGRWPGARWCSRPGPSFAARTGSPALRMRRRWPRADASSSGRPRSASPARHWDRMSRSWAAATTPSTWRTSCSNAASR